VAKGAESKGSEGSSEENKVCQFLISVWLVRYDSNLRENRKMIKQDCAALARPTEAGTEVTKTELLWVVYTVALAILNPSKLVSVERVPPVRSR
jgi:hypothetical protein